MVESNFEPVSFEAVVTAVERELEGLDMRARLVLRHRVLRRPGRTLTSLGAELAVSRERVRQHQLELETLLRGAARGAGLPACLRRVRAVLPSVVDDPGLDRVCAGLGREASSPARSVVRLLVLHDLRYVTCGRWHVSHELSLQLGLLRETAKAAGDEVGLVDMVKVREVLPPSVQAPDDARLADLLDLHAFHGAYALRHTAKARCKAVLIGLGRFATREEIGAIARVHPEVVGSHLANTAGVARVDKSRWGLRAWIGEGEEYSTIMQGILRAVAREGGEVSMRRLLAELPGRLGVARNSVHMYLRTARFRRQGDRVSLASELRLKPMDEVAHGRDAGGRWCWSFGFEPCHRKRAQVAGVPREFAFALGVSLHRARREVAVAEPAGLSAVEVCWRCSSTRGAVLSRLAAVFDALGVVAGERVCVALDPPALRFTRLAPDGRCAGA